MSFISSHRRLTRKAFVRSIFQKSSQFLMIGDCIKTQECPVSGQTVLADIVAFPLKQYQGELLMITLTPVSCGMAFDRYGCGYDKKEKGLEMKPTHFGWEFDRRRQMGINRSTTP